MFSGFLFRVEQWRYFRGGFTVAFSEPETFPDGSLPPHRIPFNRNSTEKHNGEMLHGPTENF
jgi:hypothetical protein